jgi:hypothetical protein
MPHERHYPVMIDNRALSYYLGNLEAYYRQFNAEAEYVVLARHFEQRTRQFNYQMTMMGEACPDGLYAEISRDDLKAADAFMAWLLENGYDAYQPEHLKFFKGDVNAFKRVKASL